MGPRHTCISIKSLPLYLCVLVWIVFVHWLLANDLWPFQWVLWEVLLWCWLTADVVCFWCSFILFGQDPYCFSAVFPTAVIWCHYDVIHHSSHPVRRCVLSRDLKLLNGDGRLLVTWHCNWRHWGRNKVRQCRNQTTQQSQVFQAVWIKSAFHRRLVISGSVRAARLEIAVSVLSFV